MKRPLLDEAKRLFDAGWAIHWLAPREKRPLGSWVADARVPWAELERSYRADLNIGVKLGPASHLATGYLACLDCDVKSDDPAHRAQMEKRLAELYPSLGDTPCVSSGRGLGSRHVYGVTLEPISQLILAQCGDEVRVKMPSVKPSRRERATLSGEDIRQGIRIRPAWEITLYSKGRQMALPPSVHPDSGNRYVWDKPFTTVECLVALDPSVKVNATRSEGAVDKIPNFVFNPVEVDLVMDPRVSQTLYATITVAEVPDHSAAVFSVCRHLTSAGFTQDEVLSILTDPTNALGECAYRHVQKPLDIRYRERAAYWVWKYNYRAMLAKASAQSEFELIVEEELVDAPGLSAEAAAEQEAGLVGAGLSGDWQSEIERGGEGGTGKPKATLANVDLILSHAVGPLVFKKNEFSLLEIYGMDTPWGGHAGKEIGNSDLVAMKSWFAAHFRFEPNLALLNEAVALICHRNPFHPVRDYLNALEWDGVPRVDTWLKNYLGAEAPEPYLSAISRKTLCAMVGRVLRPGIKFDCVLILESEEQGTGKSTVLSRLASPEWFSDTCIDIKDKDAVLALNGVWVMELGELGSLRKADVEQLKAFLSRQVDRIRPPYGRRTEAFPRQGIFIGTTNSDEYLRDPSGNRRIWPVRIKRCNWDAVEANRDQLFAEARWYFDLGEALWLDQSDAVLGAKSEQSNREFYDAWAEKIEGDLDRVRAQLPGERRFNPDLFTMLELFGDYGPLQGIKMTQMDQNRAGLCLKKLGYRRTVRRQNGKHVRMWSAVNPLGGVNGQGGLTDNA